MPLSPRECRRVGLVDKPPLAVEREDFTTADTGISDTNGRIAHRMGSNSRRNSDRGSMELLREEMAYQLLRDTNCIFGSEDICKEKIQFPLLITVRQHYSSCIHKPSRRHSVPSNTVGEGVMDVVLELRHSVDSSTPPWEGEHNSRPK